MNYHKQPENKQEYKAWMRKSLEQTVQIKEHKPITCICGLQLEAAYMFRCYFCGLWLCNTCSEKHFGKRPEGAYNYKQYYGEVKKMKCNYPDYKKRKDCPYYKVGYCKRTGGKCYLKEKKNERH